MCTVEAMHFIDEEDGAQTMALQSLSGLAHFGTQVFDPCENRIQGAEMSPGVIGDDSGQGRLPDTWWAMKDQIPNTICGDGTAQQSTLRKDRSLADKFVEVARAQPISERSLSTPQGLPLKTE